MNQGRSVLFGEDRSHVHLIAGYISIAKPKNSCEILKLYDCVIDTNRHGHKIANTKHAFPYILRAEEVKEHPFFKGIDWTQVYLQKYPPPLIPPRGEVNAADAFDIGSFDEEDTKGIKVTFSGS